MLAQGPHRSHPSSSPSRGLPARAPQRRTAWHPSRKDSGCRRRGQELVPVAATPNQQPAGQPGDSGASGNSISLMTIEMLPKEALGGTSQGYVIPHHQFEIVEDKVKHRRYLTLYDRQVKFTRTDGHESVLHYDIIGHPQCAFQFSVAFPFHPATDTSPAQVTLVQEYAQGINDLWVCLPTGGFDARKHKDLLECAQAEMCEEALLVGGAVVALLPDEHPGQTEVKWCRNTFKPFLFIDPQPNPKGKCQRDAEEHTIQVFRVSIDELKNLMHSGRMAMPSIYTCYLALEELQSLGLLPSKQ